MTAAALPLDASSYSSHSLHSTERAWPETNCYVDVWIEMLHALGLDPLAVMSFATVVDFEGDQWTFFKPTPNDIDELYGVDIQELTIWRPLTAHIAEQVQLGRIVLVEVDSFFLPDTAGMSYGIEHGKTTIGVQTIDTDARTMGYFHSAGYFTLGGGDFDGLFSANFNGGLAPFTEIAKITRARSRPESELREIARGQLASHFRRRPSDNPVVRFQQRLESDMAWLTVAQMNTFHQYAFATLRQLGASAGIAASFMLWLDDTDSSSVATAFESIANSAKSVQFNIARAVARRRQPDLVASFGEMTAAWETAMSELATRHAG